MLKMKINSTKVYKDDLELYMDVTPFIKNDRTYVPIRFVAEGLGYNVDWDDSTKEVTIYGRKKYFDTMDDCAYDWAMHFNAPSIALFKEFGGIIYKDEKGYYWDEVKIGREKEVFFDIEKVKDGVAFIHSHSGGKPVFTNDITTQDRGIAKKCNRPLYMVCSGGELHVTDPAKGSTPEGRQTTLRGGLPVDCKYVDMTASAENMRQYFNNNYHGLPEYEIGYLVDYYNRMYMLNKRYDDTP